MLQLRQEPGRCSLASNASCLYFVNFSFLFSPMLFSCGHAMSQIQIFLSVFNSKINSGFLQWWFFIGGTRSPTPASLYCSPVLSLYPIVVCTRWLLDQLIPVVLPNPLQESPVLGCAWLDIHCLLVWCIQLSSVLPFHNVGCIFCNYYCLSALSLLSSVLSPPFAPIWS